MDAPRGDGRRPPSAVWLHHKERGQTSFEVVKAYREGLGGPWPLKVAHGGVLDPFASGLVVVLVGAATRLFELLHEAPKQYRAVVRWGRETDTGDGGGVVVREAPVPEAAARAPVLQTLRGWTQQVPPATSNKRVDGERAHVRARRGEAVVLPAQAVYLHEASVEHSEGEVDVVLLTVRGGFYVRSLVRDWARLAGGAATVEALERRSHGPWLDPRTAPVALSPVDVLPWLPWHELDDEGLGALRGGRLPTIAQPRPATWALPPGFPPPSGVRLFHRDRLVAVHTGGGVVLLPGGLGRRPG